MPVEGLRQAGRLPTRREDAELALREALKEEPDLADVLYLEVVNLEETSQN